MTDEMKAKREKLFSSPKNGYDLVDQAALDAMETYCESYKQYLDNGKTERECAAYTVELAQAQGFVPYQRGMELKPGDKVYRSNRGKSVMLVLMEARLVMNMLVWKGDRSMISPPYS